MKNIILQILAVYMAYDLEQAEDAATKPISSTHLIPNSRYSMKITLGFVDADKLSLY
ncbi:hypothetical protein GCM10023206_19630 [Acinetobacter puyangensis]